MSSQTGWQATGWGGQCSLPRVTAALPRKPGVTLEWPGPTLGGAEPFTGCFPLTHPLPPSPILAGSANEGLSPGPRTESPAQDRSLSLLGSSQTH